MLQGGTLEHREPVQLHPLAIPQLGLAPAVQGFGQSLGSPGGRGERQKDGLHEKSMPGIVD